MIPADFIIEWRAQSRWATDEQVEQDLVLCRALVEIFQDAGVAETVRCVAAPRSTSCTSLRRDAIQRTSTSSNCALAPSARPWTDSEPGWIGGSENPDESKVQASG